MAIVLVVDDSASAREQVQSILAAAGFRVIPAPCGERAVVVLRKRAIDLIITDIYMPDGDGLEVIRSARQICPQTPILVMSGASGARNMLRVAKCLGASATLPKPFSRMELLDAVDRILGATDSRRAGLELPDLQHASAERTSQDGTPRQPAGHGPQGPVPSTGQLERESER